MDIQVTVDGCCSNWKRMSAGYVIRNLATQDILDRGHIDIAGHGTNNMAEYHAILLGCERARRLSPGQVIMYTDSQLVLRQLKGEYAVRNVRLRALHARARTVLKGLRAVVRWHSREDGDGPLADKLASYRYKEVLGGNESDHGDGPSQVGGDHPGLCNQAGTSAGQGG